MPISPNTFFVMLHFKEIKTLSSLHNYLREAFGIWLPTRKAAIGKETIWINLEDNVLNGRSQS